MTRFRMLAVFFLITSCLASGALADAAQPWVESPTNRPQFRFAPFEEAHDSDEGRISGWWSIEEKKQLEFDPSPTVVAINWSAYDGHSNPQATLGASCQYNIIFLKIIFPQEGAFINDRGSFDITYRIDSARAQSTRWYSGTVHGSAGIFGLKAETFLRDLQHAKKMFIRLTEKNGQSHDAEFDLTGIEDVTEAVIRACSRSGLNLTQDDYLKINSFMTNNPLIGAFPFLTEDDFRAIRTLLNAGGFKSGTPDGTWDKASRNAMRAFQKQNGLSVTGVPDQETLKALGFQPGGE